jgi:Domain of unknown function (DUF1707)/Cell wall-active antibiotics response 4TMS YvqF
LDVIAGVGRIGLSGTVAGEVDDASRRVSDSDREGAVVALRDDLVAGRLTLEEFSQRVESAYLARTDAELADVRDDLPAGLSPRGRRRRTRFSLALFGYLVRRGRLRLQRRTTVASVFSDVDFDLREAHIEGLELTITVFALFGNVDLYLPEGIDVELGVMLVFGRRREWGRGAVREGVPTVLVRVVGMFATVDVWRVPPDVHGNYGEVIDRVRERQHGRSAG